MRVLVTGGAGFIGHHLVAGLLSAGHDVVVLDRIDETSSLHRLAELPEWRTRSKHSTFVWHDLRAPINDAVAKYIGDFDAVFHLAASTHVDRSITSAGEFYKDNVLGTLHLAEFCRKQDLELFLYFSTDEVFGPAKLDRGWSGFHEWEAYRPGNPYAASKAAGEDLCLAMHNTFDLPVVATHCMNVVGPRQYREKFLPKVIGAALREEVLHIHCYPDGQTPGSRCYLHVDQVVRTMLDLLHRQPMDLGDKLNIPGTVEINNLEFVKRVEAALPGDLRVRCELVDFHSDRPGHDLRYALSNGKFRTRGFQEETHEEFEERFAATVRWYLTEEGRRWL